MSSTRVTLLLIALLCVAALSAMVSATDKGWEPIHWSELPRAHKDDIIEVHQLIAPLFKVKFGDFFAKLNLFHMGVGFINKRTGEEWVVDYNALPTFEDSVFPEIQGDGKNAKVVWKNYGGALMFNNIDRSYWTVEPNKVVAHINGEVHNAFIDNFLPGFNATRPYYVPLDVYSSWSNKKEEKRVPLLRGYTCSDFVWEAFNALYENGARFDCSVRARKNTMLFHGKSVNKVAFEDSNHRSKIVNFYKAVVHKFKNMSISDAMRTIWSLFVKGNAYLRHGESYIHVKLKLPYLSWHYADERVPGC